MVQRQKIDWKIRQIIAAQPGWKAVHCRHAVGEQVKISSRAIICWALVETDDGNGVLRTEIRGIIQELDRLLVVDDLFEPGQNEERRVHGYEYFLGYNDPEAHKESDYWLEQAEARIKEEKQPVKERERSFVLI